MGTLSIIGVSYPPCWPTLVAVLEIEVVLELELDQEHVAYKLKAVHDSACT